ncbi:MAG: NAD(P)/FAD-dependent oxidoreductase [Enterococcus sp.]|nr:NAD(P)/FAD-dependent oxidoreductase [Enterococcus sp.]
MRISVLESQSKLGKSILVTGNGRCNFSNTNISAQKYYNSEFAEKVFKACKPETVHNFFKTIGLYSYADNQGRMYPYTDKASTVLDVLRKMASKLQVNYMYNTKVQKILPNRSDFTIFCQSNAIKSNASKTSNLNTSIFDRTQSFANSLQKHEIAADDILFCPGSGFDYGRLAAELSKLKVYKQEPVLVGLKSSNSLIHSLDNIRAKVAIKLMRNDQLAHEETGEILFRSYGLSGIVVFNMSRYVNRGDTLLLDFFPEISLEKLVLEFEKRNRDEDISALDIFCGMMLPSIAKVILKFSNVLPNEHATKAQISKIARNCKYFPVEIIGKGSPSQAQCFRGGLDLSEFSPNTMSAYKVKGFYAAGECLNQDAQCGGFNLHWAWTTGMLAAKAIEKTL